MIFQILIAALFFSFGVLFSMLIGVLSWLVSRVLKMLLTGVIILLQLIPRLVQSGYQCLKDMIYVVNSLQILVNQGNGSMFESLCYGFYFYRGRARAGLGQESPTLAQALVFLKNNLANHPDVAAIISHPQYAILKRFQEEVLLQLNRRAITPEHMLLLAAKICELRLEFGYWFVAQPLLQAVSRVDPSDIPSFLQGVERLARFDSKWDRYETLFEIEPGQLLGQKVVLFDEKAKDLVQELGRQAHSQERNTRHEERASRF